MYKIDCWRDTILQTYYHSLKSLLSKKFKRPSKMTVICRNIFPLKSIHAFTSATAASSKKNNAASNVIRENIISAVINEKVPKEYYNNPEWSSLKNGVNKYIRELTENRPYTNVECHPKGGRKFNYDFRIVFYYAAAVSCISSISTQSFNVEFKYNSPTIKETPQFVSPMNPSKFLSQSYEEFFYDRFLPRLSSFSGFSIPPKEDYMFKIHSPTPPCMKIYQSLYYAGCKSSVHYTGDAKAVEFYRLCKETAAKSIDAFIGGGEGGDCGVSLNISRLNDYLAETQKDKVYMLYFKEKFAIQRVPMDDYTIVKYTKNAAKSRFECLTASGNKINVLLRWKNGNGIAFPSFQIS
jgi:hypothetical protein